MRSGWRILSTEEAGSDLGLSNITGTVSQTDRWVKRGKGGSSSTNQEDAATIQAREDGGLEEGDSGEDGKMHWTGEGSTLNCELIRFGGGLVVGYEKTCGPSRLVRG